MNDAVLVCNKIRTPDGTILESYNRHDYKTYKDANGEIYMVDGGVSYLRRSVNKEPYEELSVYSDYAHETIRENMTWGTYGPNGDQPLTYVLLKDMSSDHIKAILRTQRHLSDAILDVFATELSWRQYYEVPTQS